MIGGDNESVFFLLCPCEMGIAAIHMSCICTTYYLNQFNSFLKATS